MGISLLEGRDFTGADREGSEPVAIINSTLAHHYFGNEDPLNKVVSLAQLDPSKKWRIVGVVSDIKAFGPEQTTHADLYRPLAQVPYFLLGFVVRTSGDPTPLLKPAQQAIWDVDKDQPVFDAFPMTLLTAQSLALRRTSTIMLAGFAALALILAAVGLYGVIAYSVSQRSHEIGVRMALGAMHGDVLRLMLQGGMRLLLLGEAVGLAATLFLMRLFSTLLVGVSASDPGMLALALVTLALVALLATYIPARRAAKVDPMVALRYE